MRRCRVAFAVPSSASSDGDKFARCRSTRSCAVNAVGFASAILSVHVRFRDGFVHVVEKNARTTRTTFKTAARNEGSAAVCAPRPVRGNPAFHRWLLPVVSSASPLLILLFIFALFYLVLSHSRSWNDKGSVETADAKAFARFAPMSRLVSLMLHGLFVDLFQSVKFPEETGKLFCSSLLISIQKTHNQLRIKPPKSTSQKPRKIRDVLFIRSQK